MLALSVDGQTSAKFGLPDDRDIELNKLEEVPNSRDLGSRS
jgi:hypothetical protein